MGKFSDDYSFIEWGRFLMPMEINWLYAMYSKRKLSMRHERHNTAFYAKDDVGIMHINKFLEKRYAVSMTNNQYMVNGWLVGEFVGTREAPYFRAENGTDYIVLQAERGPRKDVTWCVVAPDPMGTPDYEYWVRSESGNSCSVGVLVGQLPDGKPHDPLLVEYTRKNALKGAFANPNTYSVDGGYVSRYTPYWYDSLGYTVTPVNVLYEPNEALFEQLVTEGFLTNDALPTPGGASDRCTLPRAPTVERGVSDGAICEGSH